MLGILLLHTNDFFFNFNNILLRNTNALNSNMLQHLKNINKKKSAANWLFMTFSQDKITQNINFFLK